MEALSYPWLLAMFPLYSRYLSCALCTYLRVWHIAFFYCRNCSPHTPGGSKNALNPVSIPLKMKHFWHQTIILALPERVRARLGRPSEAQGAPVIVRRNPCQTISTDFHRSQDTPNLIHVPGNTAERSVSQLSGPRLQIKKKCRFPDVLY